MTSHKTVRDFLGSLFPWTVTGISVGPERGARAADVAALHGCHVDHVVRFYGSLEMHGLVYLADASQGEWQPTSRCDDYSTLVSLAEAAGVDLDARLVSEDT